MHIPAEVRRQIATEQEHPVSRQRFEAGNSHIRSRGTVLIKHHIRPYVGIISDLKTSGMLPVLHDTVLIGP